MKEKNEDVDKIKSKIIEILKKNGVVRAAIFGSYARIEQNKDSDIDILIEIGKRKFSLFDLVGLEMELEKKLGKKVDLITYRGINPHLKKYILKDEVRIL